MSVLQSGITKSLAETYSIDNSCRFYGGSMARTPSSQGSLQKLTLSVWLKPAPMLTTNRQIWYTTIGGNGEGGLYFRTPDTLDFAWYNYSPAGYDLITLSTQVFSDPAAWYHVVVGMDTTQAVAANRSKMYVNGEQITDFSLETYPSINYNTGFNTTNSHVIGGVNWGGYLADFYYLDGTQLTPSSFGELNTTTNQWIPLDSDDVKDAVTFGTNGFYLDFADGADLGDDDSGEGNDWTVTSLDANDQMLDTPTNNFPTLNPLDENGITLAEGNLKGTGTSSQWSDVRSTIGVSSGKWYWEILYVSESEAEAWISGIRSVDGKLTDGLYWYSGSWSTATNGHCYGLMASTGDKITDGSRTVAWTDDISAGGIIGFALDLDSGTTTFDVYVNGSSAGTMYSSLQAGQTWTPAGDMYGTSVTVMNTGSDSSFAGAKTAQGNQDGNGKGDFYYTPPSGFLALCTDNLSAPEIALPGENFNTVLYAGDGASTHAITGVGYQPDLVWMKKRASGNGAHTVLDTIRGTDSWLETNGTDGAQLNPPNPSALDSFDSDGFTTTSYGNVNSSGNTFVAWSWKAGGAPTADNSAGAGATPTAGSVKIDGANLGSALAGSIAATRLSANTTAGFSIVTYTGNLTSGATVAHGLGTAPDLIIVKVLNASRNWGIGSDHLTGSSWEKYLQFTTGAELDNVNMFNDTAPSSSIFTIGNNTDINGSGDTYVAYCFNSIEGYSKVGSYTGTGSADAGGPFVYCGFKPAFLLVKSNYSDANADWVMYDNKRDPYNLSNNYLEANTNVAEVTDSPEDLDILSNGFKVLSADVKLNHTVDYIFLAFAESPFKYSNAR